MDMRINLKILARILPNVEFYNLGKDESFES